MIPWLIVGGGLHGVHIAVRLLGQAGVDPAAVRIVDPAPRLMARWRACTSATGMSHLRSPSVHHLDLAPWSLRRFANQGHGRQLRSFAPPYSRPALRLFDAHCDHLVEAYGLDELHVRARAVAGALGADAVTVDLSDGGSVRARNVVLAVGQSEQPAWPTAAPRDEPRIQHVFDPQFDGWPGEAPETVAVVGGGISAGQVALRLAHAGHRAVLLSHHPVRQHQFDSDPGWLGPKHMAAFSRERRLAERRTMISEARHRGSMPPDVWRGLARAIERGQVTRHEAAVESYTVHGDAVHLRLSDGAEVEADRALLATGFASHRPGGALVDGLVESAGLPCAGCGYPVVDRALRWHPRIRVTGPLAELELGPVARNIAGARRAGERLVDSLEDAPGGP